MGPGFGHWRLVILVGALGAAVCGHAGAQDQPPARAPAGAESVGTQDRAGAVVPPARRESIKTPITLEQTYRLSIPESDEAYGVVFHPDSKRVFVVYAAPMIDLWSAAIHYWPEELGLIAGGAAIGLGLWVARVLRRPRGRAVPHCRKCNYNLSGQPDLGLLNGPETRHEVRCPECGTNLRRKRPILGVAMWKRLAVPVSVLVLLVGGYGTMWALRLPRSGRANAWFNWTSTGLYNTLRQLAWAQPGSPFVSVGDLVKEFDLTNGSVTRTLYSAADRTFWTPTIAPDGGSLFLQGWGYASIARIDTRTGARVDLVTPLVNGQFESNAPAVLGFSPDGATAYVACHDEENALNQVAAWDLRAGTTTLVFTTAAFRRPDTRGSWSRLFAMFRRQGRVGFLSVPNFMEAYPTKTFVLKVHTPGEPERLINPGEPIDASCSSVVTPNGDMAFLTGGYGAVVIGIDLDKGETAGTLAMDSRERAGFKICLSPDGRFLVVPTSSGCLLVREIAKRRWVARLRYPPDLYGAEPSVSQDGRWVAAIGQRNKSAPGVTKNSRGMPVYAHDVVLFDLAPVLAGLDRPTGEPGEHATPDGAPQ